MQGRILSLLHAVAFFVLAGIASVACAALPEQPASTVPATSGATLPEQPSSTVPATATSGAASRTGTPVYRYAVVNEYPHDPQAFTQGLLWDAGFLYESTGLKGESTLREVELESGKVLRMHALPADYFGEGLALVDDRLVQLTWKNGVGLVYEQATFAQSGEFSYPGEGWGLTFDGARLIMSDGTATLRFLDPLSFAEQGRVEVLDHGTPVTRLNELEYIRGEVFANIWQTDRIARIDPASGQVTGWIDLSGLLSEEDLSQPAGVLNGIAYDAANERLFVTGKRWPKLFEIRLIGPAGSMLPLISGR